VTLGGCARAAGLVAGLVLALAARMSAQATPSVVAQERSRFVRWLQYGPTSPTKAVARRAIGSGLVLGPASGDIPLAGLAEYRVTEANGQVRLAGPEGERPLPRGRPRTVSPYTLLAEGAPGREVLTVFGSLGSGNARVQFYPYDPALTFEGTLAPPEHATRQRVLSPDGVEAEAVEAGTVRVPFGGTRVSLRVRRVLVPGSEESELMIYFRDGSNAAGSYPAGRFVELIPTEPGRYRLDFNRARNPYCAYNTIYPCPAPLRGNTIPVAVHAGEMYLGGGLTIPAPDSEVP
jgi:hypothetical protein